MLSSPRSPDSTMRIFSSAENWRRVARRISLMTCSAGSFTGSDCCPIFAPLLAMMGYQLSPPQPVPSVSQALTPDTCKPHIRRGYPHHDPAFGTRELQSGRHHSVSETLLAYCES